MTKQTLSSRNNNINKGREHDEVQYLLWTLAVFEQFGQVGNIILAASIHKWTLNLALHSAVVVNYNFVDAVYSSCSGHLAYFFMFCVQTR